MNPVQRSHLRLGSIEARLNTAICSHFDFKEHSTATVISTDRVFVRTGDRFTVRLAAPVEVPAYWKGCYSAAANVVARVRQDYILGIRE